MKKKLKEGQYFGVLNHKIHFNGITITDSEYTHDYVDWHCHENPYFTFLLQGKLLETNKKESYVLSPGSLIFHNWQDFHKNEKTPEFTRGAHIEINKKWNDALNYDFQNIEGSISIENPVIKNKIFKILIESKKNDIFNQISIEMLLLDLISCLKKNTEIEDKKRPLWLNKLEEIVQESYQPISLEKVSALLNLHPVYISRTFHKYNQITFGSYCRNIRFNKAINAMLAKKHSLTDIAYLAKYYDQSHMISEFRKQLALSPKKIKKLIG